MKYERINKILLFGVIWGSLFSCNPVDDLDNIEPTNQEKQIAYYNEYNKIQDKHLNNLCFKSKNQNNDLDRLKELQHKLSASQNQNTSICQEGIVFKIKLGSFFHKDVSRCFGGISNRSCLHKKQLRKFFRENPVFIGDCFKNYLEANEFKKKLREEGFKDAWLVGYKNGQRRDFKDLL